eukprot:2617289-Pleurochrysis_carterae.AAC.1
MHPTAARFHVSRAAPIPGVGSASTALARAREGPADAPQRSVFNRPRMQRRLTPLSQALSFMLRLCSLGLGCPVELEFALKLRKTPDAKHELHILQASMRATPHAHIHTHARARTRSHPGARPRAVAVGAAHAHSDGKFSEYPYTPPTSLPSPRRLECGHVTGALLC